MKFKRYRRLLLYALCLNAVFVLILYYMISRRVSEPEFTREDLLASDVDISVYLTFVIREFEHFDNAILRTEESIRSLCHKCRILVISERVPYPAINFKDRDIIFVNLAFSPEKSYNFYRVSSLISTRYTIFVPDGAQLIDLQSVKTLLHTFKNSIYVNAFAIQAGVTELTCPGLDVNRQKWTLTFTEFDGSEGMCDYVQGDQAILLETDKLDELHMPFELPLSKSLYIQFILKRWKTLIYKETVFQEKIGFQDPHSQWKHKHLEQDRWSKLLKMIGIKYVLHHIDIQIGTKKEFYYGCTKESERCFGTVLNDMPDFISEGKWTPPCCLKAIRETAHHVFTILHSVKARYWLEGGSLLGAVRHHDIIPWDYDVDIGIYLEDVSKVPGLVKCKEEAFVDEEGFVWEKATEGEFYRVQYSESNRNHVDIFPFYSRNGTMTKNTWFKTHRQDTEFPESFLKPLTHIEFIGMNVSAPNNVKNFLEYKFGNGVIEHPKYPDQMNVY